MAALITYQQAKDQLGLTDDARKPEVQRTMNAATAAVLDRISYGGSPAWDDATDPDEDREFALVQAAILIVLADLWRFRGDDEGEREINPQAQGYLHPRAERILFRLTEPTLA